MKSLLFNTNAGWSPVMIRTLLGIVIFAHGAQKLFGWFGGYGYNGTMNFFTESMGLPWMIAFLVIMLESVGALALILGFATRLFAIGLTILALGIVFTSHIQNGFYMNWFGNQAGEGIEYFILWIGMSIALIISGGGNYSVDSLIVRNVNSVKP